MKKLLIFMVLAILISSFVSAQQSYFQVPDYVEEYVFEATPYLIYDNNLSSISLDAGLHLDKTISNSSMYISVERPDGSVYIVNGNYSADLDYDVAIESAIYEGGYNWTSDMMYYDNTSQEVGSGKHVDIIFEQELVSGDRICVFMDSATKAYPGLYFCDQFYDCVKGVDDIGF